MRCRPEAIWATTHERAVVEMAWAQLQTRAAAGLPIGEPAVDRHKLRLLPAPAQWLRLHWWAWRRRAAMSTPERAGWDRSGWE